MNKTLVEITVSLLDMAAEDFSNHCSHDFEIPATPENIAFVSDMEQWNDPEREWSIQTIKNGTMLIVMDYIMMQYCADLLNEEIDKCEPNDRT